MVTGIGLNLMSYLYSGYTNYGHLPNLNSSFSSLYGNYGRLVSIANSFFSFYTNYGNLLGKLSSEPSQALLLFSREIRWTYAPSTKQAIGTFTHSLDMNTRFSLEATSNITNTDYEKIINPQTIEYSTPV